MAPRNKQQTLIITATYNRPEFLKETIESVLSQTEADFRYVIVNNGEREPVFSYVKNLMALDPRVEYTELKDEFGSAGCRNKGLEAVDQQTKFIKFLDDDDVFEEKTSLEKLVNAISENPEIGFVYGRQRRVDAEGNGINLTQKGPIGIESIIQNGSFPFTTTLFRKEVLMATGGFAKWESAEDLELICRAFIYCAVAGFSTRYIDEVLARYRKHNGGLGYQNRMNGNKQRATNKKAEKFRDILQIYKLEGGEVCHAEN